MSEAVQELFKSFDRLIESEQQDAFVAILKRAQKRNFPSLDDEDLARIADETFSIYDAEEEAHGKSPAW